MPPFSSMDLAVCTAAILLVPVAIAGLILVNTGLGRSHSAAHTILASVCVVCVAVVAYTVCGFAFQGTAAAPAHTITIAGKPWSWLGSSPWLLRGLDLDASPAVLIVWLQMLSVALAALIPLGAAMERW